MFAARPIKDFVYEEDNLESDSSVDVTIVE